MSFEHVPVLLTEVLDRLKPPLAMGLPLVDCTLGAGGHSEAFLRMEPLAVVIGIDRDSEALDAASERLARYGQRFRTSKANFKDVDEVVEEQGYEQVAAVLYDLGVSSPQLDSPHRGFGYRGDLDLDMRMDNAEPLGAADVVNNYSQNDLARIIHRFGEERFATRIARAIVARRAQEPFTKASDLAEVVKEAIPAATRRQGPHPARRTFQALRIEVNRELESLEASLPKAVGLLAPGGRVAAISYHSLEDRIVKRTFADLATGCVCPPELPKCACGRVPVVRLLTKRPVRPGKDEVARNPRSESAKMRVAEKLAPAGSPEVA